jgi:hypothetical protein
MAPDPSPQPSLAPARNPLANGKLLTNRGLKGHYLPSDFQYFFWEDQVKNVGELS